MSDTLRVPLIFVKRGDPPPLEWMVAHPGWVKFPAVMIPRDAPDRFSETVSVMSPDGFLRTTKQSLKMRDDSSGQLHALDLWQHKSRNDHATSCPLSGREPCNEWEQVYDSTGRPLVKSSKGISVTEQRKFQALGIENSFFPWVKIRPEDYLK